MLESHTNLTFNIEIQDDSLSQETQNFNFSQNPTM